MMEQAQIYLLLSPFALVLIVICLVCSLVNRKKGAFAPLTRFMTLVLCTILLTDMELLAPTGERILFWSHMTYTFMPFIPVVWFLFCRDYSGRKTSKGHNRETLLMILPVLTAAFAWTNSFHHFLWASNDFVRDGHFLINRVTAYGPWFWVHTSYSYLLYLGGMALMLRDIYTLGKIRQRQSAAAIAGVSIPVAINLVYVFRLVPDIRRDYSSLAFSASIIFFMISVQKNRPLETDDKNEAQAVTNAVRDELMTRRERDVYELLAKGLTTKEIAENLCISENTVKTHTKHVYEKMHVTTKKQLMETSRTR